MAEKSLHTNEIAASRGGALAVMANKGIHGVGVREYSVQSEGTARANPPCHRLSFVMNLLIHMMGDPIASYAYGYCD